MKEIQLLQVVRLSPRPNLIFYYTYYRMNFPSKVDTERISSLNSIVYHTARLSQSWDLKNPYFIALRCLVCEDEDFKVPALSTEQIYHLLAKMIFDELSGNGKEIKANSEKIIELMGYYSSGRQQKTGDEAVILVFYTYLMSLLNRKRHFERLNEDSVKQFLESYKAQDNRNKLFYNILSLRFLGKHYEDNFRLDDEFEVALSLLHNSLLLSEESLRKEELLVDYYLKQNKLEQTELYKDSSEKAKGRFLEVALILKASSGKGLYIPSTEKGIYLSTFAKETLGQKYVASVDSALKPIWGIPIWLLIPILFFIEAIILGIPMLFNSFQPLGIGINTEYAAGLPIWLILIINGLALGILAYVYHQRLRNSFKI
jgi:hypothetical protein